MSEIERERETESEKETERAGMKERERVSEGEMERQQHDVSPPRQIKHIHKAYSLSPQAIPQMAGKLALC